MTNPRRRSNSSTHVAGAKDFKTKFETVEPEPVFEEELHGPGLSEESSIDEGAGEKDSMSSGSIEEEPEIKKV
jgi:hypothetical protein